MTISICNWCTDLEIFNKQNIYVAKKFLQELEYAGHKNFLAQILIVNNGLHPYSSCHRKCEFDVSGWVGFDPWCFLVAVQYFSDWKSKNVLCGNLSMDVAPNKNDHTIGPGTGP